MSSYGQYGHDGRPQDSRPGAAYGSSTGYGQSPGYGQSTGYGQATDRYGDGGQYRLDDQQQQYEGAAAPQPPRGPAILTNPDFLARVDGVKTGLDSLTSSIASIASAHQRAIAASPDAGATAALDNLVANTQVLNTRIRDQIRFLEVDAARSGGNATKNSQVRSLKTQFRNRLEQYQQEEVQYKKRYQEQIARQYRIVNPDASEEEVREAVTADWGDEGVFQTALRSDRRGHAITVLGAVRARHNDIQRIERTLLELNQLFRDLTEVIDLQHPLVQQAEEQTEQVKADTEAANVQLNKSVEHARRARRIKWIICIILTVIVIAVALALGLWFGIFQNRQGSKATPTPTTGGVVTVTAQGAHQTTPTQAAAG